MARQRSTKGQKRAAGAPETKREKVKVVPGFRRPAMPAEFAKNNRVKSLYRKTCDDLSVRNLLTLGSAQLALAYAIEFSRYLSALAQVGDELSSKDRSGGIKKNVGLAIADKSLTQVINIGRLLGLDPASRQNIAQGEDPGEASADDEIARRLSGKG